MTDGVNIAVQFVENNQSNEETKDISEFYEERGQLLKFEVDTNESIDQASERFLQELVSRIKL
jgi:hypothetical protein